jgi:hypothetical protein
MIIGSADGHQLHSKHGKHGYTVALLAVYTKIYSKTRATFAIGLAVFAGMLMLHNGIAVYGYFAMAPLYSHELLPYFAVIHVAELTGLIALLKVTVCPRE